MIIDLNGYRRERRPLYYMLDDAGEVVSCDSVVVWGEWYEKAGDQRIVKRTRIAGCVVSTVFLGMDHNFAREGPPVLWESMVFGWAGPHTDEMMRYASRELAEVGHETMCAEVRSYLTGWRWLWSCIKAGWERVKGCRRRFQEVVEPWLAKAKWK